MANVSGHWQEMDAMEKREHADLVARAQALCQSDNPVDHWQAVALLHRVAELEIARLDYKAVMLERERYEQPHA